MAKFLGIDFEAESPAIAAVRALMQRFAPSTPAQARRSRPRRSPALSRLGRRPRRPRN
jgi:hypothetical protein